MSDSRRRSGERRRVTDARRCLELRSAGATRARMSEGRTFANGSGKPRQAMAAGRVRTGTFWLSPTRLGRLLQQNEPILATKPRSGTELRLFQLAKHLTRNKSPGRLFRQWLRTAQVVPERGFVAKNDRFRRTNSEPPQSTQPNRHPEARLRTRPPSSPRPSGKQTRTERVAQAQRPRTNKPKKQSDDITCGKARLGRSSERGTAARAARREQDYAAA